jgi:hypothetical protein
MHGRLGLLPQLLDAEDDMDVGHLVEMALQALELGIHVVPQRIRDVHMVTGQVDLHDWLLVRMNVFHSRRLRSLDGAMAIASRYFATVRRATLMP